MNSFSVDMLKLNCEEELDKISTAISNIIFKQFKKRGAVVALSGGIDSSVVCALCAHALGKNKVLGLLLPEKESSDNSTELGQLVAEKIGIERILKDITPMLEAAGCYRYRDEAIQSVVPEYDSSYKCKIVLPNILESEQYRVFSVITESPVGDQKKTRLNLRAYLQIVAATNFKQRVRKMMEYYHADRLNYAVIGTPNRQEYDQGFFVKLGDGAADIKPIAHLYKTQVYQLAEYLEIPEEICKSAPTTDTYSMAQTQEEFYFSVPYDKFDYCLYGKNNDIPAFEISKVTDYMVEEVERIYNDIEQKRKATRYLHTPPFLLGDVDEINL